MCVQVGFTICVFASLSICCFWSIIKELLFFNLYKCIHIIHAVFLPWDKTTFWTLASPGNFLVKMYYYTNLISRCRCPLNHGVIPTHGSHGTATYFSLASEPAILLVSGFLLQGSVQIIMLPTCHVDHVEPILGNPKTSVGSTTSR